ncbi:SDR family NAD(P)-dependent oxidoreductase [Natrarchaeobius oligotrophus]|uniref:SDR family oxidoreductase n=1 Tax=Natrarchaeobius chitinivorans TaxID=1679083 RepID=A0A3N6LVM9_NATCH|nr:SDR family oxidoreductase [Natrarchaeobius chitinivorans]RQG94528.1 SDR family oxidoreductase [Natrarchaeobius chitinivorans]
MVVFNDKSLANQTVLITGATGGIGAETANKFAEMGASLVLTGRNESKLSDLERELVDKQDSSGKVSSVIGDITVEKDRQKIVREAENVGPITSLVNSAGLGEGRHPFETLSAEQIESLMEVNYTATVLLTQKVYEFMKKRNEGTIVNISSLSGLRGTYQHIPYSASKFALTGFTHSLAVEAIEHGIRVNCVSPGWVDTEMGREGMRTKAKATGNTYEEQCSIEKEKIPSGRLTDPIEVANTIGFLVSDAAENIVGETVKISGGSVLR